jgi:UDP-glucose 4-epimerase
VGTLNLLERVRLHAEEATFIFTSTNKVYGDRPNPLPLRELETRWEIEAGHAYWILGWTLEYDLRRILKEIRDANRERAASSCSRRHANRLTPPGLRDPP